MKDDEFGATVHYKLTEKQILVWWKTKSGRTIDQKFYPRTAFGKESAQHTIQKRIDEGFILANEALV